MARSYYFITHPDVVISRDVPITEWPLSERGRTRMRAGLEQPWVRTITSIYASSERKAIDGAQILAGHLSLDFERVPALGENDRSSTGYLPPSEFEAAADEFFAGPTSRFVAGNGPSMRRPGSSGRGTHWRRRTAPLAPLPSWRNRRRRAAAAGYATERSSGATTSRLPAAATISGSRSRRRPPIRSGWRSTVGVH
jgi:hypothetical protein